jgi:hypothetical protein
MQTAPAPADTSDCLTVPTGTTTVAAEAMQSVFAMSPHDWQEVAISHILALSKDNSCAPLLLIRPTGGGKIGGERHSQCYTCQCCTHHFSLTLSCCVSSMAYETTQTVFLFASPQVFVNNPTWQKLLDVIIQKTLLRFVAYDEIHLFLHFYQDR